MVGCSGVLTGAAVLFVPGVGALIVLGLVLGRRSGRRCRGRRGRRRDGCGAGAFHRQKACA